MALLFVVGAPGVCSIEGLSADTKPAPTANFTFYETDTGKSYLADGAEWNEVLNTAFAISSHAHSASNITSSTFATARLGSGTASSNTFLRGDLTWDAPVAEAAWGSLTGELSTQADVYAEITSRVLATTVSSAAYTLLTDYAVSSHFHGANSITTSTFNLARLGSGTPGISTFLHGTSSWLVPVYANISSLPVLGTAASSAAANYASSTHTHTAGDITSSTLALARLGTGTTNISTFFSGNSTFIQPSFSSLANMPTLGTAASTAAANYALASKISTVKTTTLRFSTTTSTFAMTELAFTVSSTICYAFEFGVVFATAISTTGLRLGLTCPTFSSFAATVQIPIAAAGTAALLTGWITASGGSVVGTAVQAASTKYFASVYGDICPSANGTLQVMYATEVAASAVSTFAGCYGVLTTT